MKLLRNIRLYVDQRLSMEEKIVLSEKVSHYLTNVMRCRVGEILKCFNAKNGEFACIIEEIDKKRTVVKVSECLCLPRAETDIWLIFAPLKKDKTDFVIEKAVELGVSKIVPVITRYTNTEKVKIERFEAQAIEAAEQCGRLSVPEIAEPVVLNKLLSQWDNERVLFFMDERRQGEDLMQAITENTSQKVAVLIGPEGGFCETEVQKLMQQSYIKNINLGPRILRAETAALASLAVWQAIAGDWSKKGV